MQDDRLKMMDVWDEFSQDERKLICAEINVPMALLPFKGVHKVYLATGSSVWGGVGEKFRRILIGYGEMHPHYFASG